MEGKKRDGVSVSRSVEIGCNQKMCIYVHVMLGKDDDKHMFLSQPETQENLEGNFEAQLVECERGGGLQENINVY